MYLHLNTLLLLKQDDVKYEYVYKNSIVLHYGHLVEMVHDDEA